MTRLSDKNSFKYFLISNQLVESGVPKFIISTPVLPNLIGGCSKFLSINNLLPSLQDNPSYLDRFQARPRDLS